MNDWVHDRPYARPQVERPAARHGSPSDQALGHEDLEAGMRAGHARKVPVIAVIAFAMLLTFNSGGLVKWMEGLPSNATTAWLAERAGDWHGRMRDLGPARVFEDLRQRLKVE